MVGKRASVKWTQRNAMAGCAFDHRLQPRSKGTTIMKPFLILAALVTTLAACETTQGFGQDVQAGGRAIENTADDAMN